MITRMEVLCCRCDRCGHTWTPRILLDRVTCEPRLPKMCPRCKRPTWNDGEPQK